jgi:hypothetical protein
MENQKTTLNGSVEALGIPVTRSYNGEASQSYKVTEAANGRVGVDGEARVDPDVAIWTARVSDLAGRDATLRERYRGHIAHATRLSFEIGREAALDYLKDTYTEIAQHFDGERNAKLAYLGGSLLVTAIAESICLRLYTTLPAESAGHGIVAGLAAASLGGFLSVAMEVRGRASAAQESTLVNAVYGSLRSVFALIAGFVAFLIIKTGIALTFLQHDDAFGGLLLVCCLAGYSERYIFRFLGRNEASRADGELALKG